MQRRSRILRTNGGHVATAELTALIPGTEYIVYTAIAYTVDGTPAYTEIAAT